MTTDEAMKKLILFMLCPLWRPFPRWFRRGLRVTFEHNIHMLNWYFPLYINVLWSWDTNWIFSVCTVTQWKIKMQTIQYRRSRIREMKEDKYTKSLAKNQVCAIFHMLDIRKNVLPKFIKLCMETPCLCPFQGHKYGRRKPTETSVFEFSY